MKKNRQRETTKTVEWVVERLSEIRAGLWYGAHQEPTKAQAIAAVETLVSRGYKARAVKVTTTQIREVIE